MSCYLPGSLTLNYRVNADRDDVVLCGGTPTEHDTTAIEQFALDLDQRAAR